MTERKKIDITGPPGLGLSKKDGKALRPQGVWGRLSPQ